MIYSLEERHLMKISECFTSLTLPSFHFNLLLPDKYQQFPTHAFNFSAPLGDQQNSYVMDQSQGETNSVHLIFFSMLRVSPSFLSFPHQLCRVKIIGAYF